MKKILFLPLLFVLLCGCSKKTTVAPVLNNISFEAEIEYNENQFVCDVDIKENVFDITVTKPENINGLNFVLSDSGVTANFNEISYSKDIDLLPDTAIHKLLFNVFCDVSNGKFAEYDSENCVISGKTDGYEYNLLISPSGLPINLEFDDIDLKIFFNNLTLY